MSTSHNASPISAALIRRLSVPRLSGYLAATASDQDAAIGLYRWNTDISGAMWETIGHLEVILRNALADRLALRHRRAGRTGSWFDDPAHELDVNARKDIAKARHRVAIKHKPASDDQTISELPFGFWRFLLARRYTTILWPDLAGAFPHAPNRDRSTVEQPVTQLHGFRNRLAHHERVWSEPLKALYQDMITVVGYIDQDVATWVDQTSRISALLGTCPVRRPQP